MFTALKKLFASPEAPASQSEAFINPFDIGLWDDMDSGWFNNERNELFTGFTISADDVVLDIGCGDGGMSYFCAQRGCEVIFTDIDQHKVAQTEQRLAGTPARNLRGIVSDTNPLPLPDGCASRVIAMEILEHVDQPERFLAELARAGRPGALYLLAVPDPVAEQAQVGLAAQQYFQAPNHVRKIGRDEFEQLVNAAGLEVVSHSYYGFYWTLWWLMFWSTGQPQLGPPWNPALTLWAQTWAEVLKSQQGFKVKKTLDEILPKSQVILARKP